MEIKAIQPIEVIVDVGCDICGKSTKMEFATLKVDWGYYSKHDGDRYEIQLCETCFFYTLATLKAEKRNHHMFDDNFDPSQLEDFGLK